jgi:antitoxin (DNA-binding transcriptional repressor) of toxin-antitoxin stability system
MMTVELAELSLRLDDFIEKAQSGKLVVIRRDGKAIAELRPPAKPWAVGDDDEEFEVLPIDSSVSDIEELQSSEPRPFGLDAGKFEVTDAFFEPLPEDLLRAFNGEDDDPNLEPRESE